MVCVIDFDRTYLLNDFFVEAFFRKLLENPLFVFDYFIFRRKQVLDVKFALLKDKKPGYDIRFLINPVVHEWIVANKNRYTKVVLISASPDFFVKRVLSSSDLFDEIHGSTIVNLKGKAKLAFIMQRYGNDFDYVGDSVADKPIFARASNAYKVTGNQIMLIGC